MERAPHRRTVLLSGIVGLTCGCLGGGSGATGDDGGDGRSEGDGTPESTATETEAPTGQTEFRDPYAGDGYEVRPSLAVARSSLLYERQPGELGVLAPGDRWFFLVDLEVTTDRDGSAPDANDFRLEVGDAVHEGWGSYEQFRGYHLSEQHESLTTPYAAAGPGGWIGFDVPPGSGPPRLVLDDAGRVTWPLPAAARRLTSPLPDWRVEAPTVPESDRSDGLVTLSIPVHNDGATDGVFEVVVNGVTPGSRGSHGWTTEGVAVGAGETGTWRRAVRVADSDDRSTAAFSVVTAATDYRVELSAGTVAVEAVTD